MLEAYCIRKPNFTEPGPLIFEMLVFLISRNLGGHIGGHLDSKKLNVMHALSCRLYLPAYQVSSKSVH